MLSFDLIVIGGGSGLNVADSVAQHGNKVAVIERGKLGGTCLNRGCIPSKLLLHSADVMEVIRKSHTFGIHVKKLTVDFKSIVERVNNIVDDESDRLTRQLRRMTNVKLFSEESAFTGVKTILLKNTGETLTAEKVLIAAGSRPLIPDIQGLSKSGYITSDEALRLTVQPKVLTIIGGGYIGCELAHFFGSLGTKINILHNRRRLMRREDIEISNKVTRILSEKYNVYLNCITDCISKDRNNKFHVNLKDSNDKKVELVSDQLLVAAGRTPNSDILNLEKTNVRIDDNGYVVTNEYLETNVPGVFALGDIIGRYQFKHSANLEAQYAYHNIVNPNHMAAVDYSGMPHAIFSSPQIAAVGSTEQELRKKHISYKKSVHKYIDTGMGRAIEDNEGFVKFLVDAKEKKILGCHILGTEASILIHEVLPIMRLRNGADSRSINLIARAIHIHPALSEVVANAANKLAY
jgi:mycothione reductase